MIQLASKQHYKSFVNQRDAVLEGFLIKTRAQIADELRRFMAVVQVEINRTYPLLTNELGDPRNQRQLQALHESIHRHAYAISQDMALHWKTLRYYTALLAHAGEQQGVINVKGGAPKKVTGHLDKAVADTDYGSLNDRALLALDRLVADIMVAVKLSVVLGESIGECTTRVLNEFPKEQIVTSPRIMKKIQVVREANYKSTFGFSAYTDRADWDDFLNEYKSQFVPKWRDPRSRSGKLSTPVSVGEHEEVALYTWQLERDITDDFVQQVNDGAHEGAKQQGITDFVWIAILDGRTDPCCEKRDGLTISEIRLKLSGEWADDDCRAATPAAHPRCRCRVAPATDDLPDMPASNAAEFEDWLNS